VLASDIARTLGTVGHLRALRRARSGPFEIADALSLDALAEIVIGQDVGWRAAFRPGEAAAAGAARGRDRDAQRARWAPRDQVRAGLAPWMRAPVDALSHLPILDVSAAEAARLRHGHMPSRLPPGRAAGAYLVVSGAEVLAVGEVTPRGAKAGCVLAAGAP
jgi:tRNA U55 pseudouridine synthase TruB